MGFSPTTRAQFLQPGASEIRITWPNPLRPEFCQRWTGDPISGDVGGWYGMVIQFDDFRGIMKKTWDGDDFLNLEKPLWIFIQVWVCPKRGDAPQKIIKHPVLDWLYIIIFPIEVIHCMSFSLAFFHYSWLMMLMNESKSNHQWKINW